MTKKIIVTLSLVVLFACEKNECDCNSGSIIGKWEATDFISLESVGYPKNNDYNPVIEFKINGTVDIKLDVNQCFGEFTLLEDNRIEISNEGCTEVCCDSEFSTKFVSMLRQITSYTVERNKLRLNIAGGWINLDSVSD